MAGHCWHMWLMLTLLGRRNEVMQLVEARTGVIHGLETSAWGPRAGVTRS